MRVRFRCDPALFDMLPRPQPAREALPDWLRRMPATAFSESHGQSVRTVKQCPPFVDAMTLRLRRDAALRRARREGRVLLAMAACRALGVREHTRSPLSFHVPAQARGRAVP